MRFINSFTSSLETYYKCGMEFLGYFSFTIKLLPRKHTIRKEKEFSFIFQFQFLEADIKLNMPSGKLRVLESCRILIPGFLIVRA